MTFQQNEEEDDHKLATVNIVTEDKSFKAKRNRNAVNKTASTVQRAMGYLNYQPNEDNERVNFTANLLVEGQQFTLKVRRLATHLLVSFNATKADGTIETHQVKPVYPVMDIQLKVLILEFMGIEMQPWKVRPTRLHNQQFNRTL